MFRSRLTSSPRGTVLTLGKTATIAALGPVLAFSLVACGGGSSTASPATASPNPNASGAPGQGGGRAGFNGADFAKIQACLSAAGISLQTRFPQPSGSFVRPTDVRPSGVRPSGGRGFGAGGGAFADPKVKAALQACGIAVPTFGGGPRSAGAPTS